MLHRLVEPAVYTSAAFNSCCQALGVTQSMGAAGTSADNALAESLNATMKREVLRERKVFCQSTALPARGLSLVHQIQHPTPAFMVRTDTT